MNDRQDTGWFPRLWRLYCRGIVRVFYRNVEIAGADAIPVNGGLVLCANHVNALIDVVLVQASTNRHVRPLARSGLFLNPLLKPLLRLMGAVPIYRRRDESSDTARNDTAFEQCSELLAGDETVVIFPEGQSHSDPHIHKLKTGAARIVLAAQARNGYPPVVLPVGLTFTRKGKFRSDVLVQFGTPVDTNVPQDKEGFTAVDELTNRISAGLAAVTLNADSWEDIYLVNRLEKFFALRHGHYRKGELHQRFRALQRLIDAQRALRVYEPDKVRAIVSQLRTFEKLCQICGIRDYHLTVDLQPMLVALYFGRAFLIVLFGLPIAFWGTANGILPFLLTRHLSPRFATGIDQHDTAKVIVGLVLFVLFWGVQTTIVYHYFGIGWAVAYLVSLLVASPVALKMRSEYRIIFNNVKTFFVFVRKRQLREYLIHKRHELEIELAHLVRIVKRLPSVQN